MKKTLIGVIVLTVGITLGAAVTPSTISTVAESLGQSSEVEVLKTERETKIYNKNNILEEDGKSISLGDIDVAYENSVIADDVFYTEIVDRNGLIVMMLQFIIFLILVYLI